MCRSHSLGILSIRTASGRILKIEAMHLWGTSLAKQGCTTRSLSDLVMRYGKDSKSIGRLNHTKNYMKKSKKINLVIHRVLGHLFIPAARSLCMSIEGIWYQILNLTMLSYLFVCLWCLTYFPEFVLFVCGGKNLKRIPPLLSCSPALTDLEANQMNLGFIGNHNKST